MTLLQTLVKRFAPLHTWRGLGFVGQMVKFGRRPAKLDGTTVKPSYSTGSCIKHVPEGQKCFTLQTSKKLCRQPAFVAQLSKDLRNVWSHEALDK